MSQNSTNLTDMGYNTPADSKQDSPAISPGAKPLHNITAASSNEYTPSKEVAGQNRKKRLSFGGGNDGRGAPMFKSLETVKGKQMADGYGDQKPPDGFFGAAFKKFVNAKTGSTVAGGK